MTRFLFIRLWFGLLLFASVIMNSSVMAQGQYERRLALVIGNSDYEVGSLKNPVNDAKHVAQTLVELNFDTILAMNIRSEREFMGFINEFGRKSIDYDVAFVYYAGHGVEINGENYLLPTRGSFVNEYSVQDSAVSVQKITRYLNAATDKVNVLILDACRNNPFEKNWGGITRDLNFGRGLARIPTPKGSLVAYSTSPGSTAEDGEDELSIYCQSLCSNFREKGITLDQVFRNVRADVLNLTNDRQEPIEESKLLGPPFYLTPLSLEEIENGTIELVKRQQYDSSYFYIRSLLLLHDQDYRLNTMAGHIAYSLGRKEEARLHYRKALKLNPDFFDAIVSDVDWGYLDGYRGLVSVIENVDSLDALKRRYWHQFQDFPEYRIADAEVRIVEFNQCGEGLRILEELRDSLDLHGSNMAMIDERDKLELSLTMCMMNAYECLGDYEQTLKWAQRAGLTDSSGPWPDILMARAMSARDYSDVSGINFHFGRAVDKSESDMVCRLNTKLEWMHFHFGCRDRESPYLADSLGFLPWEALTQEYLLIAKEASELRLIDIEMTALYRCGLCHLRMGDHLHSLKVMYKATHLSDMRAEWGERQIANRLGLINNYCALDCRDLTCETLAEVKEILVRDSHPLEYYLESYLDCSLDAQEFSSLCLN